MTDSSRPLMTVMTGFCPDSGHNPVISEERPSNASARRLRRIQSVEVEARR